MACILYDCTNEFGVHEPVACEDFPLGGIDAILILHCGHSVTSASSESEIDAAITAGLATLITNIKATLPAASPVLVTPPVGCSTDKVATYDRTLTWQDGNISQVNNDNIYDPLAKGTPVDSVILYECAEDRVTWSRPDKIMRGTATRTIPDNDNEFQIYEASLSWRSLSLGTIAAAPPNIFT